MAQNYEIDIKRFNGQDYDTLLPTPASHASTHQADGSDPLTLQAGNYGALSVPTSAYQNASVTRAKLANNALYSPMVYISANRNLTATDLGATLTPQYKSSSTIYTITITQDISTTLPTGFEFACVLSNVLNKIQIATSGIRVLIAGEGQIATADKAKTFTIPELGGMIAFKKVNTGSTAGDLWVATGNVEVVE